MNHLWWCREIIKNRFNKRITITDLNDSNKCIDKKHENEIIEEHYPNKEFWDNITVNPGLPTESRKKKG